MSRIAINKNSPDKWKQDIALSVDLYNSWFMEFAPKTYHAMRLEVTKNVKQALAETNNFMNISIDLLRRQPEILPILRMSTCPPIARDRLIGLAGVSKTLVGSMEDLLDPRIPPRIAPDRVNNELKHICALIQKMADVDIFVWLNRKAQATESEVSRAVTIVADRLCSSVSDPIIRNAQEKRQLDAIGDWLRFRNYQQVGGFKFNEMRPGTFSFRTNVQVTLSGNTNTAQLNIPVDVVIMPMEAREGDLPLLIEAKSAGDFTNVNKRRKEEAQKMAQLKNTYGEEIRFGLFLCGYFDTGYLGYEAAEGIDWVWEHRIDDLALYGL